MSYKISKNVLWRVVDGEVVVVNSSNDEYSYLNPTGTDIWKMIEKGMGFEEIVAELHNAYEEKIETIEKDTKILIDELVKSKLIHCASL